MFLSYDGYVKLLCYLLIAYLYLISYNADLIRAMGYVAQVSDMAPVCFIVCIYEAKRMGLKAKCNSYANTHAQLCSSFTVNDNSQNLITTM